jgi:hypothetical protein
MASLGLDIGFIGQYSVIAVHTLQFTTAHAMSSPARSVFASSCVVTFPNNGYSPVTGPKSSVNCFFSSETPVPYRTDMVDPVVFLITSRHVPRRQYHSRMRIPRKRVYYSRLFLRSSSFPCLFHGRCLETNVISEPFANNGCFLWLHSFALSK